MKNALILGLGLGLGISVLSSCGVSVDSQNTAQQEIMLKEANAQSGMPSIVNFTEKKLAKLLIELRDEQISTFSYISNNSGLHFICNSVGYGLPYSTQYTNPERYEYKGVTLPQAEPNGLFMPSQADATWVLCTTPKGLVPVYIEATIVVSPTELSATDSYQKKPMELNRVNDELKLAK